MILSVSESNFEVEPNQRKTRMNSTKVNAVPEISHFKLSHLTNNHSDDYENTSINTESDHHKVEEDTKHPQIISDTHTLSGYSFLKTILFIVGYIAAVFVVIVFFALIIIMTMNKRKGEIITYTHCDDAGKIGMNKQKEKDKYLADNLYSR